MIASRIPFSGLNPTSNKSRIETEVEKIVGAVDGDLSESDFQQIKD